jgi:thiol-disulfide isomerase/thioredoxin
MSDGFNVDRRWLTTPANETGQFATPVSFFRETQPEEMLVDAGPLSALGSATAWLNSPPLTTNDLRGKVVLIDFWTYTCINWLRTLPYVRAWVERYQPQGLVVIGVHAPEFPFEHEIENVRRAAADMRVTYPIALDNEFTIWRAFENHYWPALYLLDAQGQLRFHHFGEGEYARSEQMIRRLLAEAGMGGFAEELVSVEPQGFEVAADWGTVQSPETYVGYDRTERFASPGGIVPDLLHRYTFPQRLHANEWALAGEWTVDQRAATLHQANGQIAFRFHARDLNVVMGPTMHGTPMRFQVSIDGQPPGEAHGGDVDAQGNGIVDASRLYQLIRQPPPITDRVCEITFLDAGVATFAFTFG